MEYLDKYYSIYELKAYNTRDFDKVRQFLQSKEIKEVSSGRDFIQISWYDFKKLTKNRRCLSNNGVFYFYIHSVMIFSCIVGVPAIVRIEK